MAQSGEYWEQECEELRTRLEFAEALAKKHEDQIAESKKRGTNRDRSENGNHRDKWCRLEIPLFSRENAFGCDRCMDEYVEDFDKYEGALRTIDQEFVLNGLKEELQAYVKLYELSSLAEIIQNVLLIEKNNILLNKRSSYSYTPRTQGIVRNRPYTKTVTIESKPNIDRKSEISSSNSAIRTTGQNYSGENIKNRGGEFKHLSSTEIREKREKGLSFRCDESCNREHR
ncbi:hypothetical protein Lal_00000752, partial [Lupinus albus]